MLNVSDIVSFNNAAWNAYIFYVGILSMKMLMMSFLTARQRFAKRVFTSPEDVALQPNSKVRTDEDVERVRRAHLNDLENIPVFMVVCAVYLLTNPNTAWAIMLMRVFTAARIIHTLVYAVVVVPQPARVIAFSVGMVTTMYMAVMTVMAFMSYM